MTYQPYEAVGAQTTVPPAGYAIPPYGIPESGSVGGGAGPVTPGRSNVPSKMKWAMAIGAAAAATALGVGAAFAVKPAPTTPTPHVPAVVNRDINSNGGKGGGSSKYGGTGTNGYNTPANNTPANNSPAINTPADPSGAPEISPSSQQTTSATEAEGEYLDAVHSQGGDFNFLSDSELLGVGEAVCSDFEGGNSAAETFADAAQAVADYSAGLDDGDMADILLAATSTLCPAYGPQVQQYAAEESTSSD